MSVKYTYQKHVCSQGLTTEIRNSSIVTALEHMDTYFENETPYVDIYFKASLSNDDKTTLDTIVENHDPTPLPCNDVTKVSPVLDELERPFVRVDSRDDHDTTVFTVNGDKWTTVTGESVGTGDGSTTVFYLDHKEVRSVVVYLDGTETETFTVDYSAFENNNKAVHFSRGRITFSEAPANGVAITADYQYATIGGEEDLLIFDFSTDTSPKTIWLEHCDPVHIKDGVVFYQNGELDSKLNVYIVCPAGNYYYDNNDTPAYASEDTDIMHYVFNQVLSGSAEMGVYFDVEARSKAVPKNYKVKMVIDKGSATSLKGSIRLEINRERTVII